MKMPEAPERRAYRGLFHHSVIVEHLIRGYVRGVTTRDGADLRDRLDYRTVQPVPVDELPGAFGACPAAVFWQAEPADPGPGDPCRILFMLEACTEPDAGAGARLAACHAALAGETAPAPLLVQLIVYNGDRPWPAGAPGGQPISDAPQQLVLDLRTTRSPDMSMTSVMTVIFAFEMTSDPALSGQDFPGRIARFLPEQAHRPAVAAILEWANLLGREHGLDFGFTPGMAIPTGPRDTGRVRPGAKWAAELGTPFVEEGFRAGDREGYQQALIEGVAAERVLLWRMAQVKFGTGAVAEMPRWLDRLYPPEAQDELVHVGEMIIRCTTAKQLSKRMRRRR